MVTVYQGTRLNEVKPSAIHQISREESDSCSFPSQGFCCWLDAAARHCTGTQEQVQASSCDSPEEELACSPETQTLLKRCT